MPRPRAGRSVQDRCGRRSPAPAGGSPSGRGGCPRRPRVPRSVPARRRRRACPRSRVDPRAYQPQAAKRRGLRRGALRRRELRRRGLRRRGLRHRGSGRRRARTPAGSSDPAGRRVSSDRAARPIPRRWPDRPLRAWGPAAPARPRVGPSSRWRYPTAPSGPRARPPRAGRRPVGRAPCAWRFRRRPSPGRRRGPADGGLERSDPLARRPRARVRRQRPRGGRNRSADRPGRRSRCSSRSRRPTADDHNRRRWADRHGHRRRAGPRNHRERADRRSRRKQAGRHGHRRRADCHSRRWRAHHRDHRGEGARHIPRPWSGEVLARPGDRAHAAGGLPRADGGRAGDRRPTGPVAHRPSPDDLRSRAPARIRSSHRCTTELPTGSARLVDNRPPGA